MSLSFIESFWFFIACVL